MRTSRKNLKLLSLTGLAFLILLSLTGSAMAQGSIFGTMSNSDLSTPANGEISFYGFLNDTDEEIRIETSAGAGYDAGNWFDDFQNYLTEGPGNPYDYYFYNVVNGQGFHLANLIPNNSFQQENIQLTAIAWPSAPIGLSGGALSSSALLVRWTAVPGETYHVFRRVQPSTSSFYRLDDPTGALTSGVVDSFFVDLTTDGVSTYDYLIIARDTSGNLSPHSTILSVSSASLVAPLVSSTDPNHGPMIGGTLVNVYGSGFDPLGATVQFGIAAPSIATVISPFHLTVVSPVVAPSIVDITVTNSGSGLSNTLAGGFTFDSNSPPVLTTIGPQSVLENELLSFVVLATDPDGDTALMSVSALPGTATFADSGDGSGTFNWLTTFADAGTYPVTFYATDPVDSALIDSEVVVITVNDAGNQAPVWTQTVDRSVAEGTNLLLILTATDADGTIPVLSALGLPPNALFADSGNGRASFDFTPTYTQAGVYAVSFIADDGLAADTMILTITVTNSNLSPQLAFIADTIVTETDTLVLNITAFDPDGNIPVLSVANMPLTNATFIDNNDGSGLFTFIPDFSQNGIHAVQFIAGDGNLADTMTVNITVNDIGNQAPVLALVSDTSINEGELLSITVVASDPDGTFPTLSALNLPSGATFADSADGTGLFEFAPSPTQSGLYTISFVADDGILADTIVFNLTVNDIGNLPPVFTAIPDTSVSENDSLTLIVSATDPDGLPGAYPMLSVSTLLNNYSFVDSGNGVGLFTYAPDYYDASLQSVSFFATDIGLPQQTAVLTVNINTIDVNQVPVIDSLGLFGVVVGDTLRFDVTASDPTDPDTSHTVLLSVQVGPANSQFVDHGDGTGTFTFAPDSSQIAPQSVTFLAVDQDVVPLSATMTATIDVVVLNNPPILAGLQQGYMVDEGATLTISFTGSDPDGGTPLLSVENQPNNSSFTDFGDGSAELIFTPDFMQGGSTGNSELYYVTFRAFDGFGYTKQVVLLQVSDAGDQLPVFDSLPSGTVVEGETAVVVFSAYDPDGGSVTLSVDQTTMPPNALFVDSGNGIGSIEFSPDFTQAGVWDIGVIVSDGNLEDTVIISFTVTEAGNQLPVLTPLANVVVGELHQVAFTVNALDLDGDFPILTASPLPGTASLNDNGDGTADFDWIPSVDDSGSYAIWFYAEDGAFPGVFDSLEMFITVVDTNRAPRGNEFPMRDPDPLFEGDTLIWRVFGYDLDGAPPTIIAQMDGGAPLVPNMIFNFPIITGDTVFGELRFMPDYSQGGPNPGVSYNVRFFLVDAADPTLLTPIPPQPLAWFVWNTNQPPELQFMPDSTGPFTLVEGDSLIFSVKAVDFDGSVVPSVGASSLPPNAFVSGTSDSLEFRFYPSFTQAGNYSVRFTALDIGGATDTQFVDIIVVEAGNQAPFFITLLSDTTQAPANTGIALAIQSADPDLDLVSITVQPGLTGAVFVDSGNGRASYTYVPTDLDVGTFHDVTWIVTDLGGLSDTISTTFSVVSFLRGDLDMNSKYTMNDLAFLISYLYRHGEAPLVEEAADVNADGIVNLLDVTYLIRFLYISGPEPPRN